MSARKTPAVDNFIIRITDQVSILMTELTKPRPVELKESTNQLLSTLSECVNVFISSTGTVLQQRQDKRKRSTSPGTDAPDAKRQVLSGVALELGIHPPLAEPDPGMTAVDHSTGHWDTVMRSLGDTTNDFSSASEQSAAVAVFLTTVAQKGQSNPPVHIVMAVILEIMHLVHIREWPRHHVVQSYTYQTFITGGLLKNPHTPRDFPDGPAFILLNRHFLLNNGLRDRESELSYFWTTYVDNIRAAMTKLRQAFVDGRMTHSEFTDTVFPIQLGAVKATQLLLRTADVSVANGHMSTLVGVDTARDARISHEGAHAAMYMSMFIRLFDAVSVYPPGVTRAFLTQYGGHIRDGRLRLSALGEPPLMLAELISRYTHVDPLIPMDAAWLPPWTGQPTDAADAAVTADILAWTARDKNTEHVREVVNAHVDARFTREDPYMVDRLIRVYMMGRLLVMAEGSLVDLRHGAKWNPFGVARSKAAWVILVHDVPVHMWVTWGGGIVNRTLDIALGALPGDIDTGPCVRMNATISPASRTSEITDFMYTYGDTCHAAFNTQDPPIRAGSALIRLVDIIHRQLRVDTVTLKDVSRRTYCKGRPDEFTVNYGPFLYMLTGRTWYEKYEFQRKAIVDLANPERLSPPELEAAKKFMDLSNRDRASLDAYAKTLVSDAVIADKQEAIGASWTSLFDTPIPVELTVHALFHALSPLLDSAPMACRMARTVWSASPVPYFGADQTYMKTYTHSL